LTTERVYFGGSWIQKKLQMLTYPLYFIYFWHSYLHCTKSLFICIYRQQHGSIPVEKLC